MRRNTKEREIVYDSIASLGHATTKQIIGHLEREDISLATIYRNLSILIEENKVKKIRVSPNEDVYETIKLEHFHFRCNSCGKIIDVDKNSIHIQVDEDSNLRDSMIGEHDIVFYGVCQKCRANKA